MAKVPFASHFYKDTLKVCLIHTDNNKTYFHLVLLVKDENFKMEKGNSRNTNKGLGFWPRGGALASQVRGTGFDSQHHI